MEGTFTQTKWLEVLRNGKPIFNFAELMRLTALSASSLRRAIHRLMQKGLIHKLGKGLYANSFNTPSLEEVACVLYPPAYISLESALFMQSILEQAPQIVTCVSMNKTKTFHTTLGDIAYHHIKRELFLGYKIDDRVLIALPEKAALDFIYLQRQNGLEPKFNEWNCENLNLDEINSSLRAYSKTMQDYVTKHLLSYLSVPDSQSSNKKCMD